MEASNACHDPWVVWQGHGARPGNGLREANGGQQGAGAAAATPGRGSAFGGGGGGLGASSAESSPAPSLAEQRRGRRPPALEPLLCGASEEGSDTPPTATPATPPTAPGSTVRPTILKSLTVWPYTPLAAAPAMPSTVCSTAVRAELFVFDPGQ